MTAAQTVLALEFRGVGDTADFSFLARQGSSAGLTRVDPLVHHIDGPLTLAEQAQLLVGQLPEALGLVLAYCGTAALGLHVAELTDAPSVLVDPYPVTAEDMRRDFGNLCVGMGIETAELGDPDAEPDLVRWEAVLWAARDGMAEVYGGDGDAYELVDDLLDRYRGWLRFLRASAAAGPVSPRGGTTVITARPEVPLGPMLTAPSAAQVHRIEDGAGILDSPEVRALLMAAVHRLEEK